MGELQLDTQPSKQIHGIGHTLLLFDAQAVPPALEFIGEEHRTFHIMNIDDNEYSGQAEPWRLPQRISQKAAASASMPVRCRERRFTGGIRAAPEGNRKVPPEPPSGPRRFSAKKAEVKAAP
jgi:hypothetical protein